MNDEPQDFSPLDPRADARRWQAMVDAVVRGAEERRRPRVHTVLRSWAAPVMAAAAIVIFLAVAALRLHARPPTLDPAYAVLSSPEELAAVDTVALLGMLELPDAR